MLIGHLQYTFWIYLLVAVAVIVFWTSTFSFLAEPKNNEKIELEFFGLDIDTDALERRLMDNKEAFTHQPLRSISVYANYAEGRTLNQLIMSRLVTADVLLFNRDMLIAQDHDKPMVNLRNYFEPLPMDVLEAYYQKKDMAFFYVDGIAYGIALEDAFDIPCIAFFGPDSPNIGGIKGKGRTEDTSALDLIAYLLGE